MSVWIVTTVAVVIVVSLSLGGAVAVGLLIRSIGPLLAEAISNGWSRDRVISLLKRSTLLVYALLFLSLLPWSVLLTTAGGMADQYFRNMVDEWMSEGELFKYLAIDEGEYSQLPLYWRQALAEITFREDDADEALRQFISRLDIDDIKILELVAAYALGGGLLESRDAGEGSPSREISRMDLLHLQAIGIIDSTLPVNHKQIRASTEEGDDGQAPDYLWLNGQQYGLLLRAVEPGSGTRLSFHVLTEVGTDLLLALRRPVSLEYLCWLQRHFRARDMAAEIWSLTKDGMEEGYQRPAFELPNVCESVDS